MESQKPFGLESYSDFQVGGKYLATANSSQKPFGLESYSDLQQESVAEDSQGAFVTKAFRLGVLFGPEHYVRRRRNECYVTKAFRLGVLFGLRVKAIYDGHVWQMSQKPFGLESYSDRISKRNTLPDVGQSQKPFGLESYSDVVVHLQVLRDRDGVTKAFRLGVLFGREKI